MQLYTAIIQRVPYDGPYHVIIAKKREFSPEWPEKALNYAGQWVLPGGKIEEGDENYKAGALREFHEETGIAESQLTIMNERVQTYGTDYTVLFIYTSAIDPLINNINQNILLTIPKDKELDRVARYTIAEAIYLFDQPWEGISTKAGKSLGKRYGQSRDWFVTALEDFVAHYDTWRF